MSVESKASVATPVRRELPVPVLVALLMVTQTIGWGTSFSLLGVLAAPIGRDLQLSSSFVYAGITVMFLVGSLLAPTAGRLTDRYGGPVVLSVGSLIFAVALMLLGLASGPISYMAAWVMFGLGMHLALVTAAYGTIAQVAGERTRRSIGILTLATGLSSTLFWPISGFINTMIDWRHVCFLYAILTLVVSFSIHATLTLFSARGATRRREARETEEERTESDAKARVSPERIRPAFAVLALAMTLNAAVGSAMALLLIDLFAALGTPRSDAVFAASLLGVAYLASRGLDVVAGAWFSPMRMTQLVFIMMPLSLVPLLACALAGVALPAWLAAVSAVIYGLPAGLLGILRPTLPFHLFGPIGYGARLGAMARPLDLANAFAPGLFALILPLSGTSVIAVAIALSLLALMAIVLLGKIVNKDACHA